MLFKNLIKIISITGLAVIIIFTALKLTRSSKIKDGSTLSVGMFIWPPFMSINQQGKYEGFDVDVAKAVAQKMGKKLIITDMGNLAPLFIALNQEKIDLLFSGLDITESRLEKIDMIRYTGENITSLDLLFWDKIPNNIKSFTDFEKLENTTICFEPGSTSEKFLVQPKFSEITKKPISSVIDMIMEIKYGRSTAAILEPLVSKNLINKNPQIKILQIPLSKEFKILGMGIGIKKKNTELKQQVEQIIHTLKTDGMIKQLEQKWNIAGGA